MTRFNLWITTEHGSRIICHGDQSEMNSIALSPEARLSDFGAVSVLPDQEEPCASLSSLQRGEVRP